jgi:hypothetical protein
MNTRKILKALQVKARIPSREQPQDKVRLPRLEIDPKSGAAYLRYRRSRIVKTVDRSTSSMTLTVDMNAKGEVVGVEVL